MANVGDGKLMTMRVVTLNDISRATGLSKGTVSRALRGDENIAETTRDRVQEVARQMNYRPNRLVQSLTTKRTWTIGHIMEAITLPRNAGFDVAQAQWFTKQGYAMLTLTSDGSEDGQLTAVRRAIEHRVDGLMFWSRAIRADDPSITELRHSGIPYVNMRDLPIDRTGDVVAEDDHPGAMGLIDHLVTLGHRDIGLVIYDRMLDLHHPRIEGIRDAMLKHGLRLLPQWVGQLSSSHKTQWTQILKDLLAQSPPKPTAYVCFNGYMAVLLVRAAKDLGLRVPEDLSVAAGHWWPDMDLFEPLITALQQDPRVSADAAGNLLLKRIEQRLNGESRSEPVRQLLPLKLRVAESTGPPAHAYPPGE